MIKRSPYKKKTFVRGRDRSNVGNYLRFTGPNPVEKKFLDNDVDDSIVATTAEIIPSLNLIPQDLTGSGRVGRKVILKSVLIRYLISLPAQNDQTSIKSGDTVRVIVYLDKQCNGAAATGGEIIRVSTEYQSYRLLSNSARFEIFLDTFHDINYLNGAGDAATVHQGGIKQHHSFIKKCNIPIEFSGITGVIGEIQSNNVGIMLISLAGIAGFNGTARIRYEDP